MSTEVFAQQFYDPVRDPPAKLVPATAKAVRMDDALVPGDGLLLEPHTTPARRPSSNNVVNDPEPSHVGIPQCARNPSGEIAEQPIPGLRYRVRVPVIGFLRTADDGTPVKATGDAEAPRAVRVLPCDGRRALLVGD